MIFQKVISSGLFKKCRCDLSPHTNTKIRTFDSRTKS